MPETYWARWLDSFAARDRLHHVNGDGGMQRWSVDSPRSYKASALNPSSAGAYRIWPLIPLDNNPYKCRILAQPLGSRRPPANWGTVVTPLQFLARTLLTPVVGAYVDDVSPREINYLARSGFCAPKHLCAQLGFTTSGRKGRPPSASMRFLGAEVSLLKNATCATNGR